MRFDSIAEFRSSGGYLAEKSRRFFGLYLGMFSIDATRRSTLFEQPLSTFLTHPLRTAIGWPGRRTRFIIPPSQWTKEDVPARAPLWPWFACSLGTAPDAPEGSVKDVSFIEQLSPTERPPLHRRQSLSRGTPRVPAVAIAKPNFALEDHYDFRDAVRALEDESWDFVVVQQGPSALASSRENLILWAGIFGDLIDENGARAIMYSVWPQYDRPFDFPNVTESYRQAADAIGALLAPAGEAWLNAWAQDSTLPLYAADDFHPSTMGTYLAALTVFERVYERTPVGVQQAAVVDGRIQSWPPAVVRLLQEAAAAANATEDARIAARR